MSTNFFDFGDFEAQGGDQFNFPDVRTTVWQNSDDVELVAEIMGEEADGARFGWHLEPVTAEQMGYVLLGMSASLRGARLRSRWWMRKALRKGCMPRTE